MTHQEIFNLGFTKAEREFNTTDTLRLLMVDQRIYFSWGVSKRVNLNNKGLMLKVSANHHKGWVLIILGWEDLYKVKIIGNNGKIIDEYDGIYFDELVSTIDDRIERIEGYVV